MANEIKGRIHAIMPTEAIAGKTATYYKRTLVLDCARYDQQSGQKYPNFPSLEFSGDNCTALDSFKQGDLVTVEFSLKGREYQGRDGQIKYFTTVSAYKITSQSQEQPVQQQGQPVQPTQQAYMPQEQTPVSDEPLPF